VSAGGVDRSGAGTGTVTGTGAPENETFVGRWSRRKRAEPVARTQEDTIIATQAAEAQALQARDEANAQAQNTADAEQKVPADLPPVDSLTKDSDYTRFMQPDVPRASRNAAMKKLFTDPHFNVMDGLDTYIDDYTKEDPIPESMLRELAQSKMLGLFDEKKEDEATGAMSAVNDDTVVTMDADRDVSSLKQAVEQASDLQSEVTSESITTPAAQPYNPPAPKTIA
jgi:Protein of unknown function (DUF3306)